MNAMNNALPFGSEPLGVTESRIVLRHLNEKYDNCGDVYAVGVKNTKKKNGAMVQMKRGLA